MLAGFVDQRTLLANLLLLLAILFCATVGFFVIVGGITGLKIALWKRAQKQAADAEIRRKLRPDGTPYPPAGRGMCDGCGKVFDAVYHLPDGAKRCAACLERG